MVNCRHEWRQATGVSLRRSYGLSSRYCPLLGRRASPRSPFTGATTTGIYQNSGASIGFTVGGTERGYFTNGEYCNLSAGLHLMELRLLIWLLQLPSPCTTVTHQPTARRRRLELRLCTVRNEAVRGLRR